MGSIFGCARHNLTINLTTGSFCAGYFQHSGTDDQVVLQSATVIVSRGGITEAQVLHTDGASPLN